MPNPQLILVALFTLACLFIPSWNTASFPCARFKAGLSDFQPNRWKHDVQKPGYQKPGHQKPGHKKTNTGELTTQKTNERKRPAQPPAEPLAKPLTKPLTKPLAKPLCNWINNAVLRPRINPMINRDWCVSDADYDVIIPGLFGGVVRLDCTAMNLNNRPVLKANTPGEQAGITGRGTLAAKCIVTARNVGFNLHGFQFQDDQETFFTPFLLDSTYLYHSNKPAWLVEAFDIDRAAAFPLQAKPGHYQLKVRGYAENHQNVELQMRIFVIREALPAGPPASFYKLGERKISSKQTALYTFSETFDGVPRWNATRQSNEFKVAIHLQKRSGNHWIHHAGPIYASCKVD